VSSDHGQMFGWTFLGVRGASAVQGAEEPAPVLRFSPRAIKAGRRQAALTARSVDLHSMECEVR
jgi:hypothetical protein